MIEAIVRNQTNLNQSFYELTQYRSHLVDPKEDIFMKQKCKLYNLCILKEETETSLVGKPLESSSNRMSTKHSIGRIQS